MALSQPRLMVAPRRSIWFALRKLRPTSEDSNQLSPVGLGSSPWLYIQSEALQGVAAHLGPVESVHLKKIRGTRRGPGQSGVPSLRLAAAPRSRPTFAVLQLARDARVRSCCARALLSRPTGLVV